MEWTLEYAGITWKNILFLKEGCTDNCPLEIIQGFFVYKLLQLIVFKCFTPQ